MKFPILITKITKSVKTKRLKYSECFLCPEKRYVTRHHFDINKTVPVCPICHAAINIGDIKFDEEMYQKFVEWAKTKFKPSKKPKLVRWGLKWQIIKNTNMLI